MIEIIEKLQDVSSSYFNLAPIVEKHLYNGPYEVFHSFPKRKRSNKVCLSSGTLLEEKDNVQLDYYLSSLDELGEILIDADKSHQVRFWNP